MQSGTAWTIVAVAAGGGVGASLRFGTSAILVGADGAPSAVATFLVNIIGCLGIGLLTAMLPETGRGAILRPLILTGLLGGLTTFSTFGWELTEMLGARRWGAAFGYAGASLAGGLAAVAAGWALGSALTKS